MRQARGSITPGHCYGRERGGLGAPDSQGPLAERTRDRRRLNQAMDRSLPPRLCRFPRGWQIKIREGQLRSRGNCKFPGVYEILVHGLRDDARKVAGMCLTGVHSLHGSPARRSIFTELQGSVTSASSTAPTTAPAGARPASALARPPSGERLITGTMRAARRRRCSGQALTIIFAEATTGRPAMDAQAFEGGREDSRGENTPAVDATGATRLPCRARPARIRVRRLDASYGSSRKGPSG